MKKALAFAILSLALFSATAASAAPRHMQHAGAMSSSTDPGNTNGGP